MKSCPYCAESVQDAAVKCRFCGETLAHEPAKAPTGPGKSQRPSPARRDPPPPDPGTPAVRAASGGSSSLSSEVLPGASLLVLLLAVLGLYWYNASLEVERNRRDEAKRAVVEAQAEAARADCDRAMAIFILRSRRLRGWSLADFKKEPLGEGVPYSMGAELAGMPLRFQFDVLPRGNGLFTVTARQPDAFDLPDVSLRSAESSTLIDVRARSAF